MRVSIYVRQLYPNCPEFLPKPMAQMLKIMLDREFLPCDFQDTPDFWQELASVFPAAEEPAVGQRSSHACSFTHLEPAGPVFKGAPPEALPPMLQQQQQQQPAQPTFPAHFVQPSNRPQMMPPLETQAQAQPSFPEPPRPQYQPYQALSQAPFQAPAQAPPLQILTPAYQPMNALRAPAAQQPLQPAAPSPHLAAAPAQMPAQTPSSIQAPPPSGAAQAFPQAPPPAREELTRLPLHMQATIPLHMHAAVLARMQAALAASKPPTPNAPVPPSTAAPVPASVLIATGAPVLASGPTPTAPAQAAPAPPRVAAYIPPHMQAAHQASALSAPAPAYPPGFTQASCSRSIPSPPVPQTPAQALDPRPSPAVTVQRVVTPEDWSYSVDPAYLAAEAEESSAGFTVVRSGGQAASKPAGVLTYKDKPARPHGSKCYTVPDLLPAVQAYIQSRLQPGHLLAEHFDSEVVRKLKGFSQEAALEVLWFVPTREKTVDNPVRNMRGFLMNNIVNMIKRIEHLQAQGR
ncbi:MAG: hypothetical protein WDW38_003935 [Sanguina aurantia]